MSVPHLLPNLTYCRMLGHSQLAVRVTSIQRRFALGLIVIAVIGAAVYAASERVVPARGRGELTSADCQLLVHALRERMPGVFAHDTKISGAACPWRAHGVRAVISPTDGGSVFVGHPRYSLLQNKAVVSVGFHGLMVGSSDECTFRRSLKGWRLASCDQSWIG